LPDVHPHAFVGPRAVSGVLAVRVAAARKVIDGATVLDGVDLDIADGEFVALLGAPGSGTTTLIRALLGLDRLDGGALLVPPRRGGVFGEPRLIETKRVLGNVLVGQRGLGARQAALAALDEVGLSDRARAWPSTLTAAEVHQVVLARALTRRPDLLLLDAPFTGLGASTRGPLQDLLADLRRRHRMTIVLATPDLEEATLLADRIVVLDKGRVALDVPVDLLRGPAPAGPAQPVPAEAALEQSAA
jgi:sulfonate transport system ATP-binding protein